MVAAEHSLVMRDHVRHASDMSVDERHAGDQRQAVAISSGTPTRMSRRPRRTRVKIGTAIIRRTSGETIDAAWARDSRITTHRAVATDGAMAQLLVYRARYSLTA